MEQSLSLPALPAGASHWMKSNAASKSELISELRPLNLVDEPRFRAAVEAEKPTSWLYYFPFLYCFAQNRRQTLLWEEVGGSICLYLLKRQKDGERLALYVPPFPFCISALNIARERVTMFNGDSSFRIAWVEERFVNMMNSEGYETRHREDEFLYDTTRAVALQGKEHSRLRQHINKALKLPDLSLSPYRKEDAHSCIGLLESWYERLTEEKSVEVTGYWYVLACIKNGHNFSPGSLEGIVTRAAGRIVGVTFGGPIHSSVGSIFICISDHEIEGLGYLQRHAFMSRFPDVPRYNDGSAAGRVGLSHVKRQFRPIGMNALFQALI